jgi:hypothetical protein
MSVWCQQATIGATLKWKRPPTGATPNIPDEKEAFGKQTIWCVWFDKTKKVEATFDIEVLQKRLVKDPA